MPTINKFSKNVFTNLSSAIACRCRMQMRRASNQRCLTGCQSMQIEIASEQTVEKNKRRIREELCLDASERLLKPFLRRWGFSSSSSIFHRLIFRSQRSPRARNSNNSNNNNNKKKPKAALNHRLIYRLHATQWLPPSAIKTQTQELAIRLLYWFHVGMSSAGGRLPSFPGESHCPTLFSFMAATASLAIKLK